MRLRCEEIAKSIKRHVDDIDGALVQGEMVSVCEHCGYKWCEDSSTYNGGCCDKDEEANPDAPLPATATDK